MRKTLFAGAIAAILGLNQSHAQLAITETMPAALSTNSLTGDTQGPDFWELSNFGNEAIDLSGYTFNDSDATRGGDANTSVFSGVTIAPGESIILVQTGTLIATRDDFTNWWGAENLPPNLQVLFYTGNGLSGSQGDSVVLWSPTATSDEDYVDRADFPVATDGHSFAYNPTNGLFGTLSSNGVSGAFKAATSDDEGSPGVNSGPVDLKIIQQPTPTNQTIPAGLSTTFTVVAQGLPHARYQWRFQGNPIDGAIQSSLTIDNAQTTNSGQYSVVVFNGLKSITSSNATLTVTTSPLAPTFLSTPHDADAFVGQTVLLAAQVSGSPSPTLQWQTNGVDLPGETGSSLTLFNVQSNQAAIYTILARNSAGTNSASATLTVGAKPKLAITEVQSTGSSSAGGHQDWWELTSFDTRTFNLKGWRWDDNSHSLAPNNAYVFTNDIFIHPGESVIFTEGPTTGTPFTPESFRAWWGTNLPANLQIVVYGGGGLGLSSGGDEVNLWNAVTLPGNELAPNERIAAVNFAASPASVSFAYDPENPPVAGIMSVFSTNTIKGIAANGVFTSAVSGDVGSPGYVVQPVHLTSTLTNGADVALGWNTVIDRSYALQYTTNLNIPTWTLLGDFIATDTNALVTDPAISTQLFYRIDAFVPFVPEQP